jgi:hypothetical protein
MGANSAHEVGGEGRQGSGGFGWIPGARHSTEEPRPCVLPGVGAATAAKEGFAVKGEAAGAPGEWH